jgi:hypothetical protein
MRTYLRLIYLISIFGFYSCEGVFDLDDIETEEEPTFLNSVKPENNDLVLGKSVFGNSSGYSEFSFIEKSSLGGFYVIGKLNSGSSTSVGVDNGRVVDYFDPVLIRFDSNGKEVWFIPARPGFLVHRMKVIPRGFLDTDEYILLSGYDNNEDDINDPDRTRLMLFNSKGENVSQFSRDFFLNLWDFEIVSNSSNLINFVGVGSAKHSDNNSYPSIFNFTINRATKQIVSRKVTQLAYIDNTREFDDKFRHIRFRNIEVRTNGNYIISAEYKQIGGYTIEIRIYEFTPNNVKYPIYEWIVSNKGLNIYCHQGGMSLYNDNVIITGYLDNSEKEGNYSSPHIRSIDLLSRETKFKYYYPYTSNPDRLFSSEIVSDKVISAGASSVQNEDGYVVGNGWIFSVDVETGKRISNITFGSDALHTQINDFIIQDGFLWGVGKEQKTVNASKGLIVKIHESSL